MTATGAFQGACLYMPALHPSLPRVLSDEAIPGLRLVVACLEDALASAGVPEGLAGLRRAKRGTGPRLFVRPRHVEMLRELVSWGTEVAWDGFVLPKVSTATVGAWFDAVEGTTWKVMPILETADVRGTMEQLGVVPLKADWTRRDEVITTWLREHGRAGVPMYLVIPKDRSKAPILLPEVITPSMVNDALHAASQSDT